MKETVKEWMKGDKKLKLIAAGGILLILLIFLSGLVPQKNQAQETEKTVEKPEELTVEEYEKRYCEQIQKLVEHIDGAGRAEVVVTLESGMEYVYAKEENRSADQQNGSGESFSERSTLDQKTIFVEDANGKKQALLKTTIAPKIRGVVVVCEGGGDILVVGRITEAVKTALGISSNRVCVTKLS